MYYDFQIFFHGCRAPVHKEPRQTIETNFPSPDYATDWSCLQLFQVPRLQVTTTSHCWKVVNHEGNVRADRVTSDHAPGWEDRQEQGTEGNLERPIEESSWRPWPSFSFESGMPPVTSACCKSAWRVSKCSSHLLEKCHVDITPCKKGINKQLRLIKNDGMPAAPKPCRQRLADSDFSDSCMLTNLCNSALDGGMLRGRHTSQGLCRHLGHRPFLWVGEEDRIPWWMH